MSRIMQEYRMAEGWFGVSKRRQQEAVKRGLKAALLHRHQQYLPLHFTEAAYSRYGSVYKPRPVWRGRRGSNPNPEKVMRSLRPLYESGATADLVRGSAKYTAQAHADSTIEARDTFSIPNYLHFISQWGYNWREELAASNRAEDDYMQKLFGEVLQEDVDRGATGKRTIRL